MGNFDESSSRRLSLPDMVVSVLLYWRLELPVASVTLAGGGRCWFFKTTEKKTKAERTKRKNLVKMHLPARANRISLWLQRER